MNTDFNAMIDYHQRERELVQRAERRRATADLVAEEFGGERLALVAHWARASRAARLATAQPTAC